MAAAGVRRYRLKSTKTPAVTADAPTTDCDCSDFATLCALFTAPTWTHAQVLLVGTLLAQGPRTVTAALPAMGLGQERRFERYHRVLNCARWSGLRGTKILRGLLVLLLPLAWPLVIAVGETLERRKGECRAGKEMYLEVGILSVLAKLVADLHDIPVASLMARTGIIDRDPVTDGQCALQ